ncbi:hypothetical protein CSA80_04930 [Candidatus Saccharibacteria bacterium]|nr:MAG: hypothetical protein CSA80_04930 [Candidatus Saccharibacteria bacterium]
MNYHEFRFKNYSFDSINKTLRLEYGYDEALHFSETYRFDFPFTQYDPVVFDAAAQQLFFLAGVSYYKMYLAPDINIEQGVLDEPLATFLRNTYQRGLGEFFYINQLDPQFPIPFRADVGKLQPVAANSKGLLVGIGGGKDSLVSVELLRSSGLDIATWSLNHRAQLTPLVERIGLPHYYVEREWDPQLKVLNEQGAYNGHVPISAIIAAVGTIVSILTGRRDHVVSNEQSANEPTLTYKGVYINHQYSKSQAFEREYQALLRHAFGDTLRYYSLLRPLSELRIAELFSSYFERYHDVFSSCNTAFRHGNNRLFWDGKCAKCAFIFLIMTPFVERAKLEALFGGRNLLLDPALEPTYRQLLGIEAEKPLDCVGEVRESREAMRQAQSYYPQLSNYAFTPDRAYDFRALASHEIPPEIWDRIQPNVI